MKKLYREYILKDGKILTNLNANLFYILLEKFKKEKHEYTNIVDFKYWIIEKSSYYKAIVRGK